MSPVERPVQQVKSGLSLSSFIINPASNYIVFGRRVLASGTHLVAGHA